MPLGQQAAIDQTKIMLGWRAAEQRRLERLYSYIHGRQRFLWLPSSAPAEVRRIAEMSRVNVLGLVVDSMAQSMYVDGYRAPRGESEAPAWDVWQRNRMDARQLGVHRAALGYGVSYTTILPGEPVSVIRGHSPRNMTAVYGDDDDWPLWALEKRRSATSGATLYRLFDDEMTYWMSVDAGNKVEFVSSEEHGLGVVPVVRFLARSDLDDEVTSEIDDLISLQDQINLTTFGLLVVQHYGAFPQKWIAGWMAETEDEQVQVAANKVLTFEDPDTKLGEFSAANLSGYIESRRDSLRNLAAISQTPAHALRGELVNLSAEALAAAEQAERRKITERETMFGEAWEQTLSLAARAAGIESDPAAQVRWKDTEARAFAATVDALGKMVQMLGIPAEELWERVPGATQQDVERWKATAAQGDSFAQLNAILERQAGGGEEGQEPLSSAPLSADDLAKRVDSAGALIRAGFDPNEALAACGLDPIRHLGLVPVTVKVPGEE